MRHSPNFNLAPDCDLGPSIGDALLEASQSQNRVSLVLRTIVEKLVLYGIPAELAPYASVLDLQEEVVTGSGVVVLEAGKRSLVLQADGAPAVQAEVVQGQIHVERAGLCWLVIREVFDGLLGEEFGVRAGGFALLHSLLLSENNGDIFDCHIHTQIRVIRGSWMLKPLAKVETGPLIRFIPFCCLEAGPSCTRPPSILATICFASPKMLRSSLFLRLPWPSRVKASSRSGNPSSSPCTCPTSCSTPPSGSMTWSIGRYTSKIQRHR